MASHGRTSKNLLVVCLIGIMINQSLSKPQDEDEDKNDEKDTEVRPLPRTEQLVDGYLKLHEVVPRIIKKSPKNSIEITYADNSTVDFGNRLTPASVKEMPTKTSWPVQKGAQYTLIFFSPDYPTKEAPTESQYVYWFVANIHENCKPTKKHTVTEYLSPLAVSPNPGLYRFIYVVYKQPDGEILYRLPYTTKYYYGSRKHFNVTDFAAEYRLGDPVAANLFQMETIHPKDVTTEPDPY